MNTKEAQRMQCADVINKQEKIETQKRNTKAKHETRTNEEE
jgi:hypothetical protein